MIEISAGISPIWHQQGLSETAILQELRSCGFRFLCEEFDASDATYFSDDWQKYAHKRRICLQQCDIKPVKARLIARNPYQQTDAILQAIHICGEMNIPHLVIPLGTTPDNTRAQYYAQNQAYLRRVLPEARMCGVTLLIEHAGNYQNAHYTHCGMELNDFLDYMEHPENLKVNVNIANQGMADIAMYPDIKILGKNVLSVDASDNFFAMPLGVQKGREDLGLAPLMGFLDFDEIMLALKEIEYDGVFNLRMDSPRLFDKHSPYVAEPKLRIMPLPLLKRYYTWAYHVTEHILKTYHCCHEAGERA